MIVAAGVQAGLQQVTADVSSCQPSVMPLRKPVQTHVDSLPSTWRGEGLKRCSAGGHQGAIQGAIYHQFVGAALRLPAALYRDGEKWWLALQTPPLSQGVGRVSCAFSVMTKEKDMVRD